MGRSHHWVGQEETLAAAGNSVMGNSAMVENRYWAAPVGTAAIAKIHYQVALVDRVAIAKIHCWVAPADRVVIVAIAAPVGEIPVEE